MTTDDLDMTLHLSHDDEARRGFIVAYKQFVNMNMEKGIRDLFQGSVAPRLEKELGRKLDDLNIEDRMRVKRDLEPYPMFRLWESMNYGSQDMMWNCIGGILDHDLPRLRKAAAHLAERTSTRGTLKLDPDLEIPDYVAETEIHRQPGGFAYDEGDDDITAAAYMSGAALMYGQGKGHAKKGYGTGDFLVDQIKSRFPDFRPRKILDVGCGTGTPTFAHARAFPEAEVTGIDCAPAFLRFAHVRAEVLGLPITFIQMNAEQMSFEDESFDLIVSHITGHETSWEGLPRMIAECWRLVKPGGVILHLDVPTQTGYLKLADQVLNDWQVLHNGEHFWMGFADSDVRQIMLGKGYPPDAVIADHAPRSTGPGHWFVHGARKPA